MYWPDLIVTSQETESGEDKRTGEIDVIFSGQAAGLYSVRLEHEGNLLLGYWVKGSKNSNGRIAYEGQVVTLYPTNATSKLEYLNIRETCSVAWMRHVPGAPLPLGAVVGGNLHGQNLYLAQGAGYYNNGYFAQNASSFHAIRQGKDELEVFDTTIMQLMIVI